MAKHIIVIGGGMAGTAAAHRLVQLGYDVTILEKNDRLGGRVHSHLVQSAAVEMGAGFLTRNYTNLWQFLEQSGLSAALYRQKGQSGIYRDGKVRMAMTQTMLGSQALSWSAKLHAIPLLMQTLAAWPQLDRHAFWKAAAYDDRSVAAMYTSQGGNEFLEYVLQPVLNGYFYWTPEHTSRAMMLILAKEAFSHGTHNLAGGLQQITEKLAEGSTVLLNHQVQQVIYNNGKYSVQVTRDGEPQILTADAIVCATTASMIPAIFPELSGAQKAFFSAVNYSSGALAARTYEAEQTYGGKAIAFPRKEGIELSSVTLSPAISTDGPALTTVKTYASGASAAKLGELTDEELAKTLVGMMEPVRTEVLQDDAEPIATFVQRWPEALPYFDVGHFKRLQSFENGEIEDPALPLVFAGDYIGGPFMEGAFTSGLSAAGRLLMRLTASD